MIKPISGRTGGYLLEYIRARDAYYRLVDEATGPESEAAIISSLAEMDEAKEELYSHLSRLETRADIASNDRKRQMALLGYSSDCFQ